MMYAIPESSGLFLISNLNAFKPPADAPTLRQEKDLPKSICTGCVSVLVLLYHF
jgi:hypothetical protein